jgi:hypothetical protein
VAAHPHSPPKPITRTHLLLVQAGNVLQATQPAINQTHVHAPHGCPNATTVLPSDAQADTQREAGGQSGLTSAASTRAPHRCRPHRTWCPHTIMCSTLSRSTARKIPTRTPETRGARSTMPVGSEGTSVHGHVTPTCVLDGTLDVHVCGVHLQTTWNDTQHG